MFHNQQKRHIKAKESGLHPFDNSVKVSNVMRIAPNAFCVKEKGKLVPLFGIELVHSRIHETIVTRDLLMCIPFERMFEKVLLLQNSKSSLFFLIFYNLFVFHFPKGLLRRIAWKNSPIHVLPVHVHSMRSQGHLCSQSSETNGVCVALKLLGEKTSLNKFLN